MREHYCLVASIPYEYHHGFDFALASALVGGPFIYGWMSEVSPILSFVGLIMGIFIGAVRIYEMAHYFFSKEPPSKSDDDHHLFT